MALKFQEEANGKILIVQTSAKLTFHNRRDQYFDRSQAAEARAWIEAP